MNSTIFLHPTTQRWLRDCPLTPYVAGYFDHLIECRYSAQTTKKYIDGIAHLGRWMSQCHLTIDQLDEKAINRFLDEHLPQCDCPRPVFRTWNDLRAACTHLLRMLRDSGAIVRPAAPTEPIDVEIQHFDEHLCNVRGLNVATRSNYLRIARRLLGSRFGTSEIVFSACRRPT